MTTSSKHMARSHRSHQATAAMLGTMGQRNYISRESKQINQSKFQRLLTSMSTRLNNLSERLSSRFSQNFRKQDR